MMNHHLIDFSQLIKVQKTDDIISDLRYIIDTSKKAHIRLLMLLWYIVIG